MGALVVPSAYQHHHAIIFWCSKVSSHMTFMLQVIAEKQKYMKLSKDGSKQIVYLQGVLRRQAAVIEMNENVNSYLFPDIDLLGI